MKRTLSIFFAVLLILICSAVMFACDKETPTDGRGDGEITLPEESLPPKTEHTHFSTHFEAKAPTCTSAGNVEFWYCPFCGKYYKDKNCEEEIAADETTVSALGHTLGDWIEELPASCTENGAVAHYHCSVCKKNFYIDGVEIKDLTLTKSGHDFGDGWIDEVPARCTVDGTLAHYYCLICKKNFDSGEEEISDLVIPAAHAFGEWLEEAPASCTEDGAKAHYYCSLCQKNFDREQNEIKDVVIPKLGHDFVDGWIDEVPAKCTVDGTIAHYYCETCKKNFDIDEAELFDLEIPAAHSFSDWKTVDEPQCETEGLKMRVCAECGAEQTDPIPASGHSYSNKICSVCRQKEPTAGLHYDLNSDKETYTVCGIGSIDTEVVIPDNYNGLPVTGIAERAFENRNYITSITIPKNITSIGHLAFRGCTGLTEIYYNATACEDLRSGSAVFYEAGCYREGITVYIGSDVTRIPAYLFYVGSGTVPKITSVVFPDNSLCEDIGNYAFYGCGSLKGVEIGTAVFRIGEGAFGYCLGLKTVTIPESVRLIGKSSFVHCTALTDIDYFATACDNLSENNFVFYEAGKSGEGITLIIGHNVTKIPAYLFCPTRHFDDAPQITSVIFETNSACETIGALAFDTCNKITQATIPALAIPYIPENSLTDVKIIGGERIEAKAFRECGSLVSVTLSEGITELGESAFFSCKSLSRVYLPVSLTRFGDSAFAWCDSLTVLYCTVAQRAELATQSGNVFLTSATCYYYSEIDPYENNPDDTDLYWHYVDSVPTAWRE